MKRPRPLQVYIEATVLLLAVVLFDAFVLQVALGVPTWIAIILNMTAALTVPRLWLHVRLPRRKPVQTRIWVDTSPNPQDPRGDGTLQPGDALYDNVFLPLLKGEADGLIVRVWDDGIYETIDPNQVRPTKGDAKDADN